MVSENNEAIIFALISFLGGIYSIITGLLALANMNIKIPGFYPFGTFISNILYGKKKVSKFEEEMMDRKKAVRYGIFWILIGLASLSIGVFFLFAT